jgi:hypothetical protein
LPVLPELDDLTVGEYSVACKGLQSDSHVWLLLLLKPAPAYFTVRQENFAVANFRESRIADIANPFSTEPVLQITDVNFQLWIDRMATFNLTPRAITSVLTPGQLRLEQAKLAIA